MGVGDCVRGDPDSGGAPALAYIDGRRRAGRMESASWTAGWAERGERDTAPLNQQPRGAWGGWARCVADSSRRVQREKLAAGRLSQHSSVNQGSLDRCGAASSYRFSRALPTRPPRFPDFAP